MRCLGSRCAPALSIVFILATTFTNLGFAEKQTEISARWQEYEPSSNQLLESNYDTKADTLTPNVIVPDTRRSRRRGINPPCQGHSNPPPKPQSPSDSSLHTFAPRSPIAFSFPDSSTPDYNSTSIRFIYQTFSPNYPQPIARHELYAKDFWTKLRDQATNDPDSLANVRTVNLVFGKLQMYIYPTNQDTIPVQAFKFIADFLLNFVYGGALLVPAFYHFVAYVGPSLVVAVRLGLIGDLV